MNYRLSESPKMVGLLNHFGLLILTVILTMAGCFGSVFSGSSFANENHLNTFVAEFCIECHGVNEQSADRRFDALPQTIESSNELADFQDILDQINLGKMPPEDEVQPSDAQRRKVVSILTQMIGDYHASHQSEETDVALRRLNAREYRNTIRDLLHIDISMFDPTEKFPLDQTTEHLDNVAGTLVTSGYLLDRYLESAETIIEKVLRNRRQPKVAHWEFTDNLHQQPEIDQVHRKTNKYTYLTLYDVIGADKHEGAYAPIHDFAQGVPEDGFYEISFLANAVNREHPYDDDFLGIDHTEPLRLGIRAGHRSVGPLHKPQPVEPLLAQIDLLDEPRRYSIRVWLDRGYTPRFTFRNGLMDARNLWNKLIKRYPEHFPDPNVSGIVAHRFNAIKYGKLPQIHVDEIHVSGPFYESWPTPGQRVLLGEECQRVLETGTFSTFDALKTQLKSFASLAFRRPVQQDELTRLLAVVERRKQIGRSELEAYGDAAKVILCSPSFLYLAQDSRDTEFDLASQLSYFLWSAPPDAQLRRVAEAQELSDRHVLNEQVDRMLADPKSAGFIRGFLDSWLALRGLGSMPPDRDQFRAYYHYGLGAAMRTETELYTRYLLEHNLSPQLFLDSDFTFANKRLAKLYGMELDGTNDFRKVELSDRRRGGLLGQASVLTVSANGVDTSPVVRGVWLLENLLGTPPSPPPPDVEPLDPDTRGAKSIRQQLIKHRETPACNDCHRKIDPLGFALENFDPIGKWRSKYDSKTDIDASGALSGGRKFDGIEQFKQLLLDDKQLFYRALTAKMLAYALGRHVSAHDRPHIDAIVAQLKEETFGLRDLVKAIVVSDPFLADRFESP